MKYVISKSIAENLTISSVLKILCKNDSPGKGTRRTILIKMDPESELLYYSKPKISCIQVWDGRDRNGRRMGHRAKDLQTTMDSWTPIVWNCIQGTVKVNIWLSVFL